MSGFESAIRNAIARAPDGRPQTRARIYDAARASLERNLARMDVPDADARRSALEMTVERIEAEWAAITMRRPAEPVPTGADDPPPPEPPAPAPLPPAPAPFPDTAAREALPAPHAPVPETRAIDPVLAGQLAERDAGRSAGPNEPSAASDASNMPDTPPGPVGGDMGDAAPVVVAAPTATSASPAREPSPCPNDQGADGPDVGVAEPIVPAVGPAVEVAPEGPDAGARSDEPIASKRPARDGTPKGKGRRAKDREKGRTAKAQRKTARAAKARPGGTPGRSGRGGKGRWASRLVSLALLVGVAVLGWRWLDASGMLEPPGTERVAVSVPGGALTILDEVAAREWTALMTRELSGAVEPVPGEDALRVTGPAEVALDAEQLVALGQQVRLSLLVRAVGAAGEVAVSCDFPGGGCGRLRFPLPREAEERVVTATVGEGGEARLVLDPTVGGETVPFDLLGVTARAL